MAEFPPEAPWGEVNMDDLKTRVARALSIPQHHTTWDLLSDAEKDLFYMQAEYAITAYNPNDRLREALLGAQKVLVTLADEGVISSRAPILKFIAAALSHKD